MEENRSNIRRERVHFNYRTNETKYYLLTEGSGYPLAEFNFPNLSAQKGIGLVVPEDRPKTANTVHGNSASQLTLET